MPFTSGFRKCTFPDCNLKADIQGACKKHYRKQMRVKGGTSGKSLTEEQTKEIISRRDRFQNTKTIAKEMGLSEKSVLKTIRAHNTRKMIMSEED